jgi:RNA-directed DNA polymerase
VALRDLVAAFERCRRGKRAAPETQAYSAHLLDHLLATRDGLNGFQWQPSPCVAFLCTRPKLREIHAAPFPDRVVHHLLIERWAALLEPGFIADSFANRRGKGTHAALDRMQGFLRRARHGGRPVWVLKLDVASFFHSVDRRRLARVLRAKLASAVTRGRIAARAARWLWRNTLVVLRDEAGARARWRVPLALRQQVPAHKRLGAHGPGIGLPIGNLCSQFFGNVVLDGLDQFIQRARLRALRG